MPLAFENSLFFCFIFHNLFLSLFQLLCRLFSDRDRFQLGTLSHSLNSKATGYQELSDWPAVAPDPSVRNVEVSEPVRTLPSSVLLLSARLKTFYHACKHNVTFLCSGVRYIVFLCHGWLSCNTWLFICQKINQLLKNGINWNLISDMWQPWS